MTSSPSPSASCLPDSISVRITCTTSTVSCSYPLAASLRVEKRPVSGTCLAGSFFPGWDQQTHSACATQKPQSRQEHPTAHKTYSFNDSPPPRSACRGGRRSHRLHHACLLKHSCRPRPTPVPGPSHRFLPLLICCRFIKELSEEHDSHLVPAPA